MACTAGRVLLRRLEKSFEQRAELAGAEEIFRMPLDAEAKARRRILDRLDHAVRRRRRRDEAGRDVLHRLMVAAVDFAAPRPPSRSRISLRQQRILVDPDLVRQLVRLVLRHRQPVRQRAGDLRRDVLHQRAAAGDVEHLHAAADREDRQVAGARRRDQRDLELVAPGLGLFDRGDAPPRRTATARRRRRRSAAGRRCRPAPARPTSTTSSMRGSPPT